MTPQWSQLLARNAKARAREKFSGAAMTADFLRILETL